MSRSRYVCNKLHLDCYNYQKNIILQTVLKEACKEYPLLALLPIQGLTNNIQQMQTAISAIQNMRYFFQVATLQILCFFHWPQRAI